MLDQQPKWIQVVSSPACLLVVADPWQAVAISSAPSQPLAMTGGLQGVKPLAAELVSKSHPLQRLGPWGKHV